MPTGEKRSSPGNGRTGRLWDGKVMARALAALVSLGFALAFAGPSLAQEETTSAQDAGGDAPVETVPGEALLQAIGPTQPLKVGAAPVLVVEAVNQRD